MLHFLYKRGIRLKKHGRKKFIELKVLFPLYILPFFFLSFSFSFLQIFHNSTEPYRDLTFLNSLRVWFWPKDWPYLSLNIFLFECFLNASCGLHPLFDTFRYASCENSYLPIKKLVADSLDLKQTSSRGETYDNKLKS